MKKLLLKLRYKYSEYVKIYGIDVKHIVYLDNGEEFEYIREGIILEKPLILKDTGWSLKYRTQFIGLCSSHKKELAKQRKSIMETILKGRKIRNSHSKHLTSLKDKVSHIESDCYPIYDPLTFEEFCEFIK